MIEVGNFIIYKNFLMAIVAINPSKNKAYALCKDNHLMATFPLDDPNVKIVKEKGCKSLVAAVYDDMEIFQRQGR